MSYHNGSTSLCSGSVKNGSYIRTYIKLYRYYSIALVDTSREIVNQKLKHSMSKVKNVFS